MIRTLAQVSVMLALIFEVVIQGTDPGLGYLVFWLVTVLATAMTNRAYERALIPQPWMFLPSLGFAISVTLYDAQVVKIWSTSLGLLTLLWAASWNLIPNFRLAGRLFPPETFHPSRLKTAGDSVWKPLFFRENETRFQARAVSRGLLLSAPLLLLFGLLLCSADAAFSLLLERLWGEVSWSLPFRLGVLTVLFAAWLKLWLHSEEPTPLQIKQHLGAIEFQVILTVLNLLFALFLTVQASYLLRGGNGILNHAEFARRGFFELSACVALILPLVALACQTAYLSGSRKLRWLGAGLILQTCGLALSAFARMILYIREFGLSIDRFYAACGIVVALFVLAWAAYVCYSPQDTSWLITRQTVTVLFLLSTLSLFNTEGWISHYNIERARQGKGLDISYLTNFSCDSLPAFQSSAGFVSPAVRELAIGKLSEEAARSPGVFSWNLSRQRATP